MMLLTALGYTIAFVLLTTVTVFMSAKIESKITFKEILDGFKRRWEAFIASFSFYFSVKHGQLIKKWFNIKKEG